MLGNRSLGPGLVAGMPWRQPHEFNGDVSRLFEWEVGAVDMTPARRSALPPMPTVQSPDFEYRTTLAISRLGARAVEGVSGTTRGSSKCSGSSQKVPGRAESAGEHDDCPEQQRECADDRGAADTSHGRLTGECHVVKGHDASAGEERSTQE